MNNPPLDSPYPLGTVVTGRRLLQNRRAEIELALHAVGSPQPIPRPHALVLGEQNSGRTSILEEVCRRAASESDRLVVRLNNGYEIPRERPALVSHLLTGIVEALAAELENDPPWYTAWRSRVHLRKRHLPTEDDLLSSALAYAVDPEATLDRNVFLRDLRVLRRIARRRGFSGFVVKIDDASPLSEDVRLVEYLFDAFDEIGGYSLLMGGLPTIARHFNQAASPCLERCDIAFLMPFRGQHQIFTALSAPLTGPASEFLRHDPDMLGDILQLTGGNPYELMLVGHYLLQSCTLGEHESYTLTPKVLDRMIPALSRLIAEGDALLDGTAAIEQLPEQHVRQAVELVALSGLSVREVAIVRLLGVNRGRNERIDAKNILTAQFEEEEARVRAELLELEDAGVVELEDDHFRVIGGPQAAVVLKYKARARIGAETSNWPFGRDFLSTAGWALARDAMLRTLERLPDGSTSLGASAVRGRGAGTSRLSAGLAIQGLRESDDIDGLVDAEVDLNPWDNDAYRRIARLLKRDEPRIALVCNLLEYGSRQQQLEYTEVWELPDGVTETDLLNEIATASNDWKVVVEAADLEWLGNKPVVLSGRRARRALIAMHRFTSITAVQSLFDLWCEDKNSDSLDRAILIATEAVAVMRETGRSDTELDGELSAMLSRLGFMKSFDAETLTSAREALEEALKAGAADSWITNWVLASVLARLEEPEEAHRQLRLVAETIGTWYGTAFVVVNVPGRAVADSVVSITEAGVGDLLALQKALIDDNPEDLFTAIDRCLVSDDPGAVEAAKWASRLAVPHALD